MKKILLIIFLTIFVGCATVVGQDFPIENTEKIQKKITTKSEIFTLFGEPSEKQLAANGIEIWSYTYSRHTPDIVTGGKWHHKTLTVGMQNGIVVDFDKLETFKNDGN